VAHSAYGAFGGLVRSAKLTKTRGDLRKRPALSEDGARTFTAPSVVSAPGDPSPWGFANPHVVPDFARHLLYVVYAAGGDDLRWDVMLATSRDGGKTSARTRVNDDAPCANHRIPTAVLDPKSGRVHVAWLDNRSGFGEAVWAACDSGGAHCGPNERISDAPFTAFRHVRLSPRWLGEYPTLLADPKHDALHLVWTQTVDEDGHGIARIFWAKTPLD
jgi:hypothetical protein